jgi:ABC-2 type transport system permease protein
MDSIAWMIAFMFAPFSAVFYPVEILPQWACTIAWGLPTTYIFEGMRQIIYTGEFPSYYFLVSLLLDLIYLTLSFTLFQWVFKKSLAKGLSRLE